MKAAWYERQGPARDVLEVGQMDDPEPKAGEIRIQVAMSGVHPGDVKKRKDSFATGLPYPRVVPHSDGAGWVEAVGTGVDPAWVGNRAWCFEAQSYRPFGTAAGLAVVPRERVIELADDVPFEEAASIGIPGITAHRAVDVAGPLEGKTVLVQGAAGAVGACAVHLARRQKARVLATVRKPEQEELARRAGAHDVVLAGEGLAPRSHSGRWSSTTSASTSWAATTSPRRPRPVPLGSCPPRWRRDGARSEPSIAILSPPSPRPTNRSSAASREGRWSSRSMNEEWVRLQATSRSPDPRPSVWRRPMPAASVRLERN